MKEEDRLELFSQQMVNKFFSGQDKQEQEIIIYGLLTLLSTLLGLMSIVVFSSLVRVTSWALVAALAAVILRRATGGVHASSAFGCALLSGVIFTLLGLLAKYSQFYLADKMLFVLWGAFLIGALLIYFYAPVGVEERPLSSINKRGKLRIYSFLILFILSLISFIILAVIDRFNGYILAILLGIIWQLFTITPLAYRLFNREYERRGDNEDKKDNC